MRESERPGKVIEYLMLAGNVFLGLVVLELIVHGLVDYPDASFLFQTQKKTGAGTFMSVYDSIFAACFFRLQTSDGKSDAAEGKNGQCVAFSAGICTTDLYAFLLSQQLSV